MIRSYWGHHQLSAGILGPSQARAQYWGKTCCFAELLSSVLRQESQSHPYFFRQTSLPCLVLLTAITLIFTLPGFLPAWMWLSHSVLWPVVLTTAECQHREWQILFSMAQVLAFVQLWTCVTRALTPDSPPESPYRVHPVWGWPGEVWRAMGQCSALSSWPNHSLSHEKGEPGWAGDINGGQAQPGTLKALPSS